MIPKLVHVLYADVPLSTDLQGSLSISDWYVFLSAGYQAMRGHYITETLGDIRLEYPYQ